jgi:hypothetical protein
MNSRRISRTESRQARTRKSLQSKRSAEQQVRRVARKNQPEWGILLTGDELLKMIRGS